jgi:hypothetical protein
MIGGDDMHLKLDPGPNAEDIDFVLRMIRGIWPKAVVEDLTHDEMTAVAIDEMFPARLSRELLIYRDAAALAAWEEHGATSETQPTLIHVLAGDNGLTFVVDARGSEMGSLVDDMMTALVSNRARARMPWKTAA